MADTIIALILIWASLAWLLIAGLIRAAAKRRPTNAASAPDDHASARMPVRAPSSTDECMIVDCILPWSADRAGWRTCGLHTTTTGLCKVCEKAPATELSRLCLPCHVRIRDHFDEFVDQALAIANSPDPDDEVGEADLSLWEIESGWAKS